MEESRCIISDEFLEDYRVENKAVYSKTSLDSLNKVQSSDCNDAQKRLYECLQTHAYKLSAANDGGNPSDILQCLDDFKAFEACFKSKGPDPQPEP